MTDRILELAEQAGITGISNWGASMFATPNELRKFAALVRRDALEEAKKVCDDIGDDYAELGNSAAAIALDRCALYLQNLASKEES